MRLLLVLFAVFLHFCTSGSLIVRYSEEQKLLDHSDVEAYIQCECGGQKTTQRVPSELLLDIYRGVQRNSFCTDGQANPVCDLLNTCEFCSAHLKICSLSSKGGSTFECISRRFGLDRRDLTATETENGRIRRQVAGCAYPLNLKTADLICMKYPNHIKCKQKCIFGYTLNEGISRQTQCFYQENVWKPLGFEECQPFVDCTLSLVYPGKLDCTTGTTKAAPVCNVSCENYEDKEATPLRSFECRIIGGWNQRLPFCVTAGSGLALVNAPRIKLHPLDHPDQRHNQKHKKKNQDKNHIQHSPQPDHLSQSDLLQQSSHLSPFDHLSKPDPLPQPSHSGQSDLSLQPNRSSKADHLLQPIHLSQPDHLVKPSHLSQPDHLVKPSHLSQPDHLVKPSHLSKPDHLVKPSHLSKPDHLVKPSHLSQSDHLVKPIHLSKPDHLRQPSHLSPSNPFGHSDHQKNQNRKDGKKGKHRQHSHQ